MQLFSSLAAKGRRRGFAAEKPYDPFSAIRRKGIVYFGNSMLAVNSIDFGGDSMFYRGAGGAEHVIRVPGIACFPPPRRICRYLIDFPAKERIAP